MRRNQRAAPIQPLKGDITGVKSVNGETTYPLSATKLAEETMTYALFRLTVTFCTFLVAGPALPTENGAGDH